MNAGLRRLIVWCGCLSLAGCGSSAPPADHAADVPNGPASATSGMPGESPASFHAAMPMPPGNLTSPNGPAGAVKTALGHVRSGNLEQAYDFLPASYQQDVDRLVQEFARTMDAEVWEQVFEVLRKGVRVLRTKQALIIGLVRNPDNPEPAKQLDDNWNGLVETLELLVESELADLDQLKRASTRKFLETTGNPLFSKLQKLGAVAGPNPIDALANVQVELVNQSQETATLRFVTPQQLAEPEETEFVKVDGKWIPRSLSESWDETMQQARQTLAALTPETINAQKAQALEGLGMIDGVLDQMLAAQSSEQLQGAAMPLFFQAIQIGSAMQQKPASPVDGVTLIISSELSDEAQTKLLNDLEQYADTPEHYTYEASASSGETTIVVRPVADPVAFAEKLPFAKKKSVDIARRTIRMELAAP